MAATAHTLEMSVATLAIALDQVIAQQSLDVHFQPIVDVRQGRIVGYEALTRAPASSALHSPLVLFDVAAQSGRLVELERLVMRRIVQRFQELQLPGFLFLNVTADTIQAIAPESLELERQLSARGLAPARVVVELTETRPVFDAVAMTDAVTSLRGIGLLMALDDLGEGFSGLKRWVDLKPDFVKVDRHFIDGIANDPLKQQFVRAILEMATSTGTAIIAEGLEQEGDLDALLEIGVHLCQGYLLARPTPTPRAQLGSALLASLRSRRADPAGRAADPDVAAIKAGDLARPCTTISPGVSCQDAFEMFRASAHLYSIPVVGRDGTPLGLLRSMDVLQRGSERYFMEIHGRSSCTLLMDTNPLTFDVNASLRAMSQAISDIDDRYMVDGFVVTRQSRFIGLGRTSELLKSLSDLQVVTAQNANPLTRLPGNLAIDRHLGRLLSEGTAFVISYWDISHFKAFNDVYGYGTGDDVIRFTGGLLSREADQGGDFVGHIGGDDFVLVLGVEGWRERLDSVCSGFDAGVRRHLRADHVEQRGYSAKDRQGRLIFHPLPTLTAGVLLVAPGRYATVRQLSSALAEPRAESKRIEQRSGYFVDRRQ